MTTCCHPIRATYANFQICSWCGQWLPLIRVVYGNSSVTTWRP